MSAPYREAANIEIEPAPKPKAHLVRANGMKCLCTPPGWFWCWWYSVRSEDRWHCEHGGRWVRAHDGAAVLFPLFWRQVKP